MAYYSSLQNAKHFHTPVLCQNEGTQKDAVITTE